MAEVVPFKPRPKKQDMETRARIPHSDLDSYFENMIRLKLLSRDDVNLLEKALAPLLAIFPFLETIETVREEIAQEGVTKDFIRSEERCNWLSAGSKGESFIAGFDFEKAYDHFLVTSEEDENRTVVFLGGKNSAQKYVPPSRADAETFFFVILRMFRYQFNIEMKRDIDELNEKIAELEEIEERERKLRDEEDEASAPPLSELAKEAEAQEKIKTTMDDVRLVELMAKMGDLAEDKDDDDDIPSLSELTAEKSVKKQIKPLEPPNMDPRTEPISLWQKILAWLNS